MPETKSLSLIDVCLRRRARRSPSWESRDVSLTVASGEIVGVAGLNREGREELLLVAAGLELPNNGRVQLTGIGSTNLSSKHTKFVPNLVLWSSWTDENEQVDDSVGHSLVAGGLTVKEADRRAWTGLAQVGLSDCASYALADLSALERLLVEVARAVLVRPRFIVMDGLLDALGPSAAVEAEQYLRRLMNDLGCGVLLGAADPASILMADRVWCLDQGCLVPMPTASLARTNVSLLASGPSWTRKASPPWPVAPNAVLPTQASTKIDEMPKDVKQLLATEAALDKLGARGISTAEAGQTLWNGHVVIKNLRGSSERPQRDVRRLLIGRTDAGRILTLVIEETIEPTAWLLVTGWDSTRAERMIMERS